MEITREEFNDKMQDFEEEKNHVECSVEQEMEEDEHIEWNCICHGGYDDDKGDFINDNKAYDLPTYEDVIRIIEEAKEQGIKNFRVFVEDRCDTHSPEGDYYPSEDYATVDIYSSY